MKFKSPLNMYSLLVFSLSVPLFWGCHSPSGLPSSVGSAGKRGAPIETTTRATGGTDSGGGEIFYPSHEEFVSALRKSTMALSSVLKTMERVSQANELRKLNLVLNQLFDREDYLLDIWSLKKISVLWDRACPSVDKIESSFSVNYQTGVICVSYFRLSGIPGDHLQVEILAGLVHETTEFVSQSDDIALGMQNLFWENIHLYGLDYFSVRLRQLLVDSYQGIKLARDGYNCLYNQKCQEYLEDHTENARFSDVFVHREKALLVSTLGGVTHHTPLKPIDICAHAMIYRVRLIWLENAIKDYLSSDFVIRRSKKNLLRLQNLISEFRESSPTCRLHNQSQPQLSESLLNEHFIEMKKLLQSFNIPLS